MDLRFSKSRLNKLLQRKNELNRQLQAKFCYCLVHKKKVRLLFSIVVVRAYMREKLDKFKEKKVLYKKDILVKKTTYVQRLVRLDILLVDPTICTQKVEYFLINTTSTLLINCYFYIVRTLCICLNIDDTYVTKNLMTFDLVEKCYSLRTIMTFEITKRTFCF